MQGPSIASRGFCYLIKTQVRFLCSFKESSAISQDSLFKI